MREKSIRYRAPEQLRQRSRREALEPPSGTTLPIRYRRMAEETARSEPEGRGTPSGGRTATDDKTARKPRPEAGRNPRTTTAGAEPQGGNPTERRQPTSEPEGRGTPSGSRAATDDKTARKPRPEAGRNPRTTTAGAEPQGGDRRKKRRSRPPEGDGSEQVRYEVLCQRFSHPDSEEATSIHTSFS